jgi:hypothetical protein
MSDLKIISSIEDSVFVSKHRFVIMIVASIVVASVLVAVGLFLYNSSGAAQLDLSRPGYKDVRTKVVNDDSFKDYSGSGSINQAAINDFKLLYSEQAKKIELVDAFGGDPLSPVALGMSVE